MNFFLTLIHGNSVNSRMGFIQAQKKRMLLSAQTLLGIRVTGKVHHFAKNFHPLFNLAKSLIKLIQYLYSLPEVQGQRLMFLSNNLCQDPLENFFWMPTTRGGTIDNLQSKTSLIIHKLCVFLIRCVVVQL